VRDAAASGQSSLSQAAAINQTLNGLPTTLDAAQRREAEDLILTAAEHLTPEKLRTMSEKLTGQVAPQLTETAEQRAERLEARDARARARRCLRFGPETDGSIDFSGSLPVVDGRQLQQLVQRTADRAYRAAKDSHNHLGLSETPQQRLADALVVVTKAVGAVADGASAGASEGATDLPLPCSSAQLVVVVPHHELLDRAKGRGLLMDGTSVSPGELRRMACSADIIPVILDGGSKVIDVGRAHRLAPPPLRMAIGLRDGGCAFPGCSVPIWHCDVHHIVPWQQGGQTTLGNTVALCRTHHGLLEPAPPSRLVDGTLQLPDQRQVRIDGRGLPEFIPPAAADPTRTPMRKISSHVQELLDTG
jgi:hypothetical protein